MAKTPEDYTNQYFTELQKIEDNFKASCAHSKIEILAKMKAHLSFEQKQGKLKQVLSLKDFISKLEKGDYSSEGLDLIESPKGQEIFKQYEKQIQDLEKAKATKKEKLLTFFKKAMKRKVVELTKAGKIDEAIKFQKLADEGPEESVLTKPFPVEKVKPEVVEKPEKKKEVLQGVADFNKNGDLQDGFYQASAWNERTPAFVAVESGKVFLIRIKPNKSNKKIGMYQLYKWPFIANPLCIAANGKPGDYTYIFFDKLVIPPIDVAEFYQKYKDGSKFPLVKLKGDLPQIRKITDEELRTLPQKFRNREVH